METSNIITVVGMSDLHGQLPTSVPPGDVCCICGDILPLNIQNNEICSAAWLAAKFIPWCDSLPCDKVYIVPGNHDFLFEIIPGSHTKFLKKLQYDGSKVVLLMDSGDEFKGFKFWGSPWCPDLSNWAFYADSEKLKSVFAQIPKNTDVLLTHCPPRIDQFGMSTQAGCYGYMTDFGCQELADAVRKKQPELHIFGHVHTGRHRQARIDGTTFANVSLLDENYMHSYNPQVFIICK